MSFIELAAKLTTQARDNEKKLLLNSSVILYDSFKHTLDLLDVSELVLTVQEPENDIQLNKTTLSVTGMATIWEATAQVTITLQEDAQHLTKVNCHIDAALTGFKFTPNITRDLLLVSDDQGKLHNLEAFHGQLNANSQTSIVELKAENSSQSLTLLQEGQINITMQQVGFHFVRYVSEEFDYLNDINLTFFGTIQLGHTPLDVALDIPVSQFDLEDIGSISIHSRATLGQGLKDLSDVLDIQLLPNALRTKLLTELTLRDLTLTFNFTNLSVDYIRVEIASEVEWELFTGFIIHDIGLFFTRTHLGWNFVLFGHLEVGSGNFLAVMLQIFDQKQDWILSISTSGDNNTRFDFENFDQLALNTPLNTLQLPPDLSNPKKQKQFDLNSFKVVFNPWQPARLTSLELDIDFLLASQILPNIFPEDVVIDDIQLSLELFNPLNNNQLGQKEINGTIAANFLLEEVALHLSAAYRQKEGWVFSGYTELDQSISLTQLSKSILHQANIELPKSFPEISFKNLNLEIKPKQNYFHFQAEATVDSSLNVGEKKASFFLDIDLTHESDKFFGTFSGELDFFDIALIITYQIGENKTLEIETHPASLSEGATINLKGFVEVIASQELTWPKELPNVEFSDLHGSIVTDSGDFSLSGNTNIGWQLFENENTELKLKKFEINKANQDISGSLTISIAAAEIALAIRKQDNGWYFDGSTGPDQKIPIGMLIEDLVDLFGNVDLPSALEELIIENLAVSFNTQSKDFTFSGEAKFPVEGQEVDITITIDIKHQQDNSYNKHFSGQLKVDGLVFNVLFDETPDVKVFVAAYHDQTGKSIKVDDLIKKVFETSLKTGLEFTLKDAVFAYRSYKEGQVAKSQYLFGLDIEGGLNLSELKLPDLPLIGSPLPPEQTLNLAFQVLLPSQSFTVDQVTIFNGLISGGSLSLPQKALDPPVNLSVVLRMGQASKLVELPIGVSTQTNGQGNGLVSQNQAQVTTTSPSGAQATAEYGTQWLKIQKSFGPVYFERVGLKYESGAVTGLLDAALSAGGLTLSLDGLAVKSPLDHFAPQFSLHGLGLDYQNGPLEIGGSLLQVVTEQGTEYDGLAVIRTEALTLVAIGSYARVNDDPSLFIYAVLDYPLGGPSFFFITGLAAGFGYNRRLNIPPIEQVATFPLVAQVIGGNTPPSLPTNQAGRQKTLSTQVKDLSHYIPPTVGESFLAVGIKFTSFKLIDSFAMLVVQFGQHFEIDILGLSILKVPTPEAGKSVTPLGEARLALRARFAPDEGILTVRAQLTADSYILSRNCHLTGGFAFYAWFDPHPHQGDFVITLGGYHPRYTVPSHYPRVPRLGFNWQVDRYLSLKGDVYFALTPHALMAGGHLEAIWQKGSLKAWFKAGADFLINWKPYHYDISIYVSLRASYTFFKVELAADLHIWGPDFAGKAHIHWCIISFTVHFGSHAAQKLKPIDWPTFKSSFLPEKQEEVCGVSITAGLVRQVKDDQQRDRWIINPKELALTTNSVIPINQAPGQAATLTGADTTFGVRPVGVKSDELTTSHTITITSDEVENPETFFKVEPSLKAMPASLWAEPELDGQYLKPPDLNEKQLVEKTLAGFKIKPAQPPKSGTTDDIDRRNLQYETEQVPDAYTWQDFAVEPEDLADDIQIHKDWPTAKSNITLEEAEKRVTWALVDKTIVTNQETNQAVSTRRADLLQALGMTTPAFDFGQSPTQDTLFPPQIEAMTDEQETAVGLNQLIETVLTTNL